MKLLKLEHLTNDTHKYKAIFQNPETGRTKTTKFGYHGMDDFTLTHDREQRDRYRARHAKDLQTGDPSRAGFLSYYLLWGNSTSISENLRHFRNRFNV